MPRLACLHKSQNHLAHHLALRHRQFEESFEHFALLIANAFVPAFLLGAYPLGNMIAITQHMRFPRLAQKACASGIHLILATQRPEAATFSGLLRSNCPSRIALHVQKGSESKIILDELGAESLLGKGDMLVKIAGGTVQRSHGYYLHPEDIQKHITAN